MKIINDRFIGLVKFDESQFDYDNWFHHLRYIGKSDKPTKPIGLVDYSYMFAYRDDLEVLDLSSWDMSKAKYLTAMFSYCTKLNDISSLEKWDLSNAINTRSMFSKCSSLWDISYLYNWNTPKLENSQFMFYYCEYIEDISHLKNWNLSSINILIKCLVTVIIYQI